MANTLVTECFNFGKHLGQSSEDVNGWQAIHRQGVGGWAAAEVLPAIVHAFQQLLKQSPRFKNHCPLRALHCFFQNKIQTSNTHILGEVSFWFKGRGPTTWLVAQVVHYIAKREGAERATDWKYLLQKNRFQIPGT